MGADQSTTKRNRVQDQTRNPVTDRHQSSDEAPNSVPSRWRDSRSFSDSTSELGSRTRGTLVVVKPALEKIDIENDPITVRLKSIPFFNPILMNKDKLAWTKEGERIRQKIDPSPLLNIGLLFQTHVRREATLISRKQNDLTRQIKIVDHNIGVMIKTYTDRQKKSAKHAEKLNKINDFAHVLAKCQAVLNDCKRTSVILNEMLPADERLEPFVWVEDLELTELSK